MEIVVLLVFGAVAAIVWHVNLSNQNQRKRNAQLSSEYSALYYKRINSLIESCRGMPVEAVLRQEFGRKQWLESLRNVSDDDEWRRLVVDSFPEQGIEAEKATVIQALFPTEFPVNSPLAVELVKEYAKQANRRKLAAVVSSALHGGAFSSTSRQAIPEAVRHAVWRRDEGRCVQCGVNENLEFDHIIPHSRGGGNSERNLQLLCEPCNRTKSATV